MNLPALIAGQVPLHQQVSTMRLEYGKTEIRLLMYSVLWLSLNTASSAFLSYVS